MYKKPAQPIIYEKFNPIKIPSRGLDVTIKKELAERPIEANVHMNSSGKYGLYDKYGKLLKSGYNTKEDAINAYSIIKYNKYK